MRAAIASLCLLGLCVLETQAQTYPYYRGARSIVLPGASFRSGTIVQPYLYRPSAYGPYYGQGLSAIQTRVGYRYIPRVNPGDSFLYYQPRIYLGVTPTYQYFDYVPRTNRLRVPSMRVPSLRYHRTRPAFR